MFYNGHTDPQAIYPRTPVTDALQAIHRRFRVAVVEGHIMPGNASMTQKLDNALGNDDSVGHRYLQFANRSNSIDRVDGHNVITPPAQRFFDLANVEFVFTTRPVSSTAYTGWKLWRKDGNARVYRNPHVLPRTYAVANVHVVAPERAVDAVYEPAFDPRHSAVVEEPIPGLRLTQQTSRRPQVAFKASTQISGYEPERVTVDVDVSQPALLVLSDSYAPGWHVSVDGSPSRLYRANGVYRGVFVNVGQHRVTFSYEPHDVYWGMLGAVVTLGLCLLGCWIARRFRSRRED